MKKLKIEVNKANEEKMGMAIKAAEGKATARTASFGDIERTISKVEHRLGYPLKKTLHGLKINFFPDEKLPNAYKYRAQGTGYQLENIKGKWYLTDVFRADVARISTTTHIMATDEQKAEIIKGLLTF